MQFDDFVFVDLLDLFFSLILFYNIKKQSELKELGFFGFQ